MMGSSMYHFLVWQGLVGSQTGLGRVLSESWVSSGQLLGGFRAILSKILRES
jgi:hypothetical protein